MDRVARIMVFKIWPSQEILKIHDGAPLEAEGILTYIKKPSKQIGCMLDVPSNVLQKKRMARILVFKIWPSQEILKIRDGTPLEAEGILTYIKSPRNRSVWHFSRKLDVPSNVVHKKRMTRIIFLKIWPSQEILKIRDVARIIFFKIWPSQEILKIRVGTPLEAEGILTYIKRPRNRSVWHFPSKLDAPSNILQKKREARIMVFKIWPSQEILKIHDGTPLEAEGILTYIKKTLEMDRFVARIMVFKIWPSQEILKIHDGAPLEAEGILTYIKKPSKQIEILKIRDGTPLEKRVARILVFKIWPSQEILKIRDGAPLEAEGILTYIKSPRNRSVWHFSSKLDVPSNILQNKRVARILVFKIWPSQEILKIRDGTPLEAEGILKRMARILVFKIWPSQEILKIRDVARIIFFKIWPSQEILKIRDGTPLEAEGILTYIKSPRNRSVWHFPSKLDVPSNILQKKRVARIMVFKIWPSQEILKIHDGTPLEAEGILTYIKKKPRNGSVWPFFSKLYVPSNILQKKRVARIMVFKIWPSQEILKIHDGAPLEAEGILTYIKKPSKQIEIFKIGDGTPLEAEGILTYIKSPRNRSVWHFSNKLDVPSNVLHKKRVAWILVFKIWPSQEIHKIRDGITLEKMVARILVFKIWSSQEILKIRDGTPLEAEGILTYIKSPRNRSVWHFSSKLDVPSNVLQKKRVAWILVFKIWPSQEIHKIRDGTPLEAEGILTYIKSSRNRSVRHFSSKLDVPSNILQTKRVARNLVFKIWPSQEIFKIRDGTPLEAEGILTYIKSPRNRSVWHFSSKLDVPSNILQKKRVARILVFKIWPSQEILKIRDGTPLEAEGILTYIKSPRNRSVWHFSSKLDVPSNVLQKKRVAWILLFKIWPSQEILKIRDGTPLEAEGILTYIKKPSKQIGLALF
ncbi:hypothetical protein OROMI_004639 [Orobanche minor]